MTEKVYDQQGRWRNKIVAFRISPGENEQLNKLVKISGQTKQDYIITRLLEKEFVVMKNPRVYKGLKDLLAETRDKLNELIEKSEMPDEDTKEIIRIMTEIIGDMKGV